AAAELPPIVVSLKKKWGSAKLIVVSVVFTSVLPKCNKQNHNKMTIKSSNSLNSAICGLRCEFFVKKL
ncbi:MAG: hypothetical protein L0L75_08225, partial [Enterobacterales bacterium]|nr:hypothetical protein [Enterobacterales bacterium]